MITKLLTPKVQGAFRHLLTSIGPLVATNGIATEAEWQVAVGVIMAILGFAASWFAPEKN